LTALEQISRTRGLLFAAAAILLAAGVADLAGLSGPAGWLLLLLPAAAIVQAIAGRWYRRELTGRLDTREWRLAPGQSTMPERHSVVQGELRSLGFRQLPTIETRLPWQPWTADWLAVDRAATTVAHVSGRPGALFSTYWPDGAIVTTTNRWSALRVGLPDARQEAVHGPAADAYRRHRDACAAFGKVRPGPLEIGTAEDLIAAALLTRPAVRHAYEAAVARPTRLLSDVGQCVASGLVLCVWLIQVLTR